MNPLTYTVPDAPVIDTARGIIAGVGVLLLVFAPAIWWRLRHQLPHRIRGLLIVLIGSDVYISATEAQQIGRQMVVWRLPLAVLVIVGALAYLIRLATAVDRGEQPR